MRKSNLKLLSIMFGCAWTMQLNAAVNLSFGQPTFFGTGCNEENTLVSQGDNMLLISFMDYTVEVGGNTNQRIAVNHCNIDIPLQIPRGYSAVIERVEYDGAAVLPSAAKFSFNSDFELDTSRRTSLKKTINGPFANTFTTAKDFVGESSVSTNCQEKSVLRIISNLRVSTNENYDKAYVSIANLNASGYARYRYRMMPCF